MTCTPRVWGDVLRRLQEEIPDFAYDAWIAPLDVKLVDGRVILGCPTSFHRDRVRIQYAERLESCLAAALGAAAGDPAMPRRLDGGGAGAGPGGALDTREDAEPGIRILAAREFAEIPGRRLEIEPALEDVSADPVPMAAERRSGDPAGVASGLVHAVHTSGSSDEGPREERPARLRAMPPAGAQVDGAHVAGSHAVGSRVAASPPIVSARSAAQSVRPAAAIHPPSDAPDPASARGPGHAPHTPHTPSHARDQAPGPPAGHASARSPVRTVATPRAKGHGGVLRAPGERRPLQSELPFSFESFVVGPCNALAREASLALARERQRTLNQLYLGGETGMGKTRLARATAAEARRHGASGAPNGPGSGRTIVYTSAEQFTSEFVSAMRNGRSEEFKRRYRGPIGLLVVEDVQF